MKYAQGFDSHWDDISKWLMRLLIILFLAGIVAGIWFGIRIIKGLLISTSYLLLAIIYLPATAFCIYGLINNIKEAIWRNAFYEIDSNGVTYHYLFHARRISWEEIEMIDVRAVYRNLRNALPAAYLLLFLKSTEAVETPKNRRELFRRRNSILTIKATKERIDEFNHFWKYRIEASSECLELMKKQSIY